MAKISKRRKEFLGKYDLTKPFALNEALDAVKACANAKFDESVDVAIQLGIDPRKSDQAIRGAVVMPEGTGKTVRVAVFTQGANVEAAKAAGADIVGFDDLAAEVKAGKMDFDVVIASPDATVGRVSFETERLVTNIKALVEQLNKLKPASQKGIYMRKLSVSSTMGIGARVDLSSL